MPILKFEVVSVLNRLVRAGGGHWQLIVEKHPSVSGKEGIAKRALVDADEVRRSKRDSQVYLYYLAYNQYWMCVVCKHENGTGFVVTAYVTDRIKEGACVWKR